jgi:hypothetical protein
MRVRSLILPLILSAGCRGAPPAMRWDANVSTPRSPGDATVLVRTRPLGFLARIAVDGNHLYFSSRWDGVYEMPRYGGEVVTLEADAHKDFDPLTASAAGGVVWLSVAFDGSDFPHSWIRHRATGSTRIETVYDADFGVPMLGWENGIAASQTAVTFIRDRQGPEQFVAVPLGGGPPRTLLEDVSFLDSPTFAVDDEHAYYSHCDWETKTGCFLDRIPLAGGPATRLSTDCPAPIEAMDQKNLYIPGVVSFAMDKVTGQCTQVGNTITSLRMVGSDAENLYLYGTNDRAPTLGSHAQVWRLPKAGGTPVAIYEDPQSLQQVIVDGNDLFLLRFKDDVFEIAVVTLPPSAFR